VNDTLTEINTESNSFEIKYLIDKFNQLENRTKESLSFQKHTIHHISHQLKTPIAVLVSELERIEKRADSSELKSDIEVQILKTKSLGNIINVLLEISKIESGQHFTKQTLRIDELIFDLIAELKIIYSDFYFEVNYSPKEFSDSKLEISANPLLIKQALQNVLSNSIAYSDNARTEIIFDCSASNSLKVSISNTGSPITAEEEKFIFNHFFRGQNSQHKIGFGLGLVLTKKILEIHSSTITYSNPSKNLNVFEISFPLS
jgi:signal transduction histidine kinase